MYSHRGIWSNRNTFIIILGHGEKETESEAGLPFFAQPNLRQSSSWKPVSLLDFPADHHTSGHGALHAHKPEGLLWTGEGDELMLNVLR